MEIKESPQETTELLQNDCTDRATKRRNPFRTQKLKEEKDLRQKREARIVVRNISFKASEEDLRKHFEQWGKLEEVNVLKRPDGKLVGCAFIQYETINEAKKATFRGNNKEFLGRPLRIEKSVDKRQYEASMKLEPPEKKLKKEENCIKGDEIKSENSDDEEQHTQYETQAEDSDDEIKEHKSKLEISKLKNEKRISNDVEEGCTIFIKNVPMDAEDRDLRKVCRKYGPIYYAIINREAISGHSKGTAFVKFKTKESADLCLQAGSALQLMEEILQPYPALSRDELHQQTKARESSTKDGKDSRNLYLAREGLIMAGSKAAEGVSASDMNKRHKLEQIKTQVLKNLNRFVSRNRLSIHNLPLNYDNDNLRDMVITYTGFKPHECRVMRENKITPEHPKGKSKGFGFMSFATHQNALLALRKLNNNPKIFGQQHRPIVAFSIEDRAVQKVKEKRQLVSKLNNPTYKKKLEERKLRKQQKRLSGKTLKGNKGIISDPMNEDKEKLKKHIKRLEESRAALTSNKPKPSEDLQDDFIGTPAKPGHSLRMRSFKKIQEQSQVHLKRVKDQKKKVKQQRIRKMHLAERKADIRPKQGRQKVQKDNLQPLVNKYRKLLENRADNMASSNDTNVNKLKRTKWYAE